MLYNIYGILYNKHDMLYIKHHMLHNTKSSTLISKTILKSFW